MNPDKPEKHAASRAFKRLLKIFAVAVVLIVIVMGLSVVNSIFGNPVSAGIATVRIRHYVAETYPDMNPEVPRARYNFKMGEYFSQVQSPDSPDTRFSVGWKDGEIHDGYESAVVGRITTYNRLTQEFDDAVEQIIAGQFPHETDLILADLSRNEEDLGNLTLDMPLDIRNLPLAASLTVWIYSDILDYDVMADRLLELHRLMSGHGIEFETYTLRLMEPVAEEQKPGTGENLYLMDFPAGQIAEEGLAGVLEEHQRQWEAEHDK